MKLHNAAAAAMMTVLFQHAGAAEIQITFEGGGHVRLDGRFYPATEVDAFEGVVMVESPMTACQPGAIGNTAEVLIYRSGQSILSLKPGLGRLATASFVNDGWRVSMESEQGGVVCAGSVAEPTRPVLFKDGFELGLSG